MDGRGRGGGELTKTQLILTIGDFHIPHRAVAVPSAFRKLLMPGKIHQGLCVGNLTCSEVREWLRSVVPEVHLVKGDMDQPGSAPLAKVVTLGPLRVGLLHGHSLVPMDDTETLALAARQMDVDVLVSGGTGVVDCFEFEGRLYVNPGSATGALAKGGAPSFVLLDVVDTRVTVYVYQLVDDEVKIVKLEYIKPSTALGETESTTANHEAGHGNHTPHLGGDQSTSSAGPVLDAH